MARPTIPAAQQKRHRVIFRLTDEERMKLSHQAAALGVPINELARDLTLSRAETLIIEAQASPSPALLKQLHHIGHNLNQLVKNAHIFGEISPRVAELYKRIDDLIDQAINEGD